MQSFLEKDFNKMQRSLEENFNKMQSFLEESFNKMHTFLEKNFNKMQSFLEEHLRLLEHRSDPCRSAVWLQMIPTLKSLSPRTKRVRHVFVVSKITCEQARAHEMDGIKNAMDRPALLARILCPLPRP